MIAIPSRNKSLALLAGMIIAQVLLLAVQIKREQQVRLIRIWAVELISPVQRSGAWAIYKIERGWNSYFGLRNTMRDNQALRAELGRLKVRNAELEGRALEADRLAGLLNFRETHADVPMTAARVIGASPDPGSLIVYVNRGAHDSIRPNMGVITPDGVVGKILAVYPDTSQVLLLGDKESGVGAILATTRTQAPVKGTGGPQLSMDYVSNEEKVSVGEAVLTSGQDRIFPKDLPVGTVVEVTPDRKTPFMRIRVKPAARLDRLEEVLILLTQQELDSKKEKEARSAPSRPAPTGAAKAPPGAQ
jgi:rod shape-determining protein MreC